MLEDPKIDALNQPRIRTHSDHVLADAKDYEWEQVREWSEDTFTLLSQKVVPIWDDQFESQNQHHRSSTSHDKAGKLVWMDITLSRFAFMGAYPTTHFCIRLRLLDH